MKKYQKKYVFIVFQYAEDYSLVTKNSLKIEKIRIAKINTESVQTFAIGYSPIKFEGQSFAHWFKIELS